MTILQLEYLLKLAKVGNYSRAAESLGISQPALSLQVKRLEENLGFAIVDRSKKKVSITKKGQLFLNRAQLLINESQQLKNLASQMKDDNMGELKIGIIPTLAPYLLPMFIDDLHRTYENLKISIKEALTEEIIRDLKAGDLDGGIISTPISTKTVFEVHPLFYEAFLIFVASDHPLHSQQKIKIADIPYQDVWLLKEGNCFRDQVNNICEITGPDRQSMAFNFESNSIESLCRIVEFKGGITFLPELSTIHISPEREDMIKQLSGSKKVREISFIHLPNHIYTREMNLFSKIIKSNIPKNLLNKEKKDAIPTNVNIT